MWTCSQTYFLSSHISIVDLLKPETRLCFSPYFFFSVGREATLVPLLLSKMGTIRVSLTTSHAGVIIKWDEVGHLSLILLAWQLSLLPVLEGFRVSWGGSIPLQLGPGHQPEPQALPIQQALSLPNATPHQFWIGSQWQQKRRVCFAPLLVLWWIYSQFPVRVQWTASLRRCLWCRWQGRYARLSGHNDVF